VPFREGALEKTIGSNQHCALVEFLVQQREKIGMTQSDLADALGEYQSFVARLESGQRRVDVVEFMRFAEVLQFNAADVLKDLQNLKS
jgi:transcriptional regulator with XRE-family HTH domain